MPSTVEICNMALGHTGVQQTIASLDEQSNEARACKRFYTQTVKEVLQKFNWPFATRYVLLAVVEEAPNVEWAYSYRYPTSCEKVRRVIPSDITVDDNYRDPFVVASDSSGKLIYSNQLTAMAEITFSVTDSLLFDSMFVGAVSWRLASLIAPSLTGNNFKEVVTHTINGYKEAISAASTFAMNEGHVSTSPYSEIIQARE